MRALLKYLSFVLLVLSWNNISQAQEQDLNWIAVKTPTKIERTKLVSLGFSIESVVDDMSYGFAAKELVAKIARENFTITSELPLRAF